MNVSINHSILAVITSDEEPAPSGGAVVFRIRDAKERERVARYIGTVTLGVVHDLRNGTYIVVKHG